MRCSARRRRMSWSASWSESATESRSTRAGGVLGHGCPSSLAGCHVAANAIDATTSEDRIVLRGREALLLGLGVRAEHVVVQPVDAALLLGCRGPEFHSDGTGRRARRHLVQVADAHVLEAVRDALAQVGNISS